MVTNAIPVSERSERVDSEVDCGHLFWLAFWQLNPTLMTTDDGRASERASWPAAGCCCRCRVRMPSATLFHLCGFQFQTDRAGVAAVCLPVQFNMREREKSANLDDTYSSISTARNLNSLNPFHFLQTLMIAQFSWFAGDQVFGLFSYSS